MRHFILFILVLFKLESRLVGTAPEATCPSNEWFELGDRCILVKSGWGDLQNWEIAKTQCEEHGGMLASIYSEEENTIILEKMKEKSTLYHYWTGLHQENGEFSKWLDGSNITYTNWHQGEPNGEGTSSPCVRNYIDNGEWDDFFCYHKLGYVCQAPKAVFGGWEEYNGKIYFHSANDEENQFTWYSARSFCNNKGGELASIHSLEEINVILSMLETPGSKFSGNFWIGLNKLQQDSFRWTDQSDVDYSFWLPGQQSNDGMGKNLCVVGNMGVEPKGSWTDTNCGKPAGFICQKDPDRDTPIEPTAPDDVNGYCPTGFFSAGTANKCYKMEFRENEVDGLTWRQALALCRQEPGKNPDIASISTDIDNAWITTKLHGFTRGLWMGMKRDDEDMEWVWTDSSDTGFKNWAPTQPENKGNLCGEVSIIPEPSGAWTSVDCEEKRGYICQTFKDPENIISTPDSTLSHGCKTGYHGIGENCYKLVNDSKSWSAADQHCRGEDAVLMSIQLAVENAAAQLLADDAKLDVWTGLQKQVDSDEWSWVDGGYVMYSNWETDYPTDTEGADCMLMDSRGRWVNQDCNQKYPFLCEIASGAPVTPPSHIYGTCPSGENWAPFGGYCYYFDTNNLETWQKASEICLEVKAVPVSIHSDAENQFVYEEVNKRRGSDTRNSWLGLYKSGNDGSWRWFDGSAVQFTNWVPGSPAQEESCTTMNTEGRWTGYWQRNDCSKSGYAICKTLKGDPTTPPPVIEGQCPTGGWDEVQQSCFKYYPDAMLPWKDAQANCTAQGGQLAAIHTPTQNVHVYDQMMLEHHLPFPMNYWIGLNRTTDEADFLWIGGRSLGFMAWAPGEPNGQEPPLCVEVYTREGTTAMWNDHFCDTRNGFVCETPKVPHSQQKSGGLSAGTIVGIVFCLILGFLLIALILFVVTFRRQHGRCPGSLRDVHTHAYNATATSASKTIEEPVKYENNAYHQY